MPFAVEGLIRGPAGSIHEDPRQLFHAAQSRGMTLALEQAAYCSVLTSFAALEWPGKLFLNVLPSSLLRSIRLPRDLRRAIADAGLHPSQIVLELTEHDPIPNGSALLRVLDPFFDEGLSLSIDDVGAGFANMRLICELQPHFLKVDQFFLAGIRDSPVKQSALRQFIHFAGDIGAKIIVEGVECEADAEVALHLGVGFMQGHLFGRPTANPCFTPRKGA